MHLFKEPPFYTEKQIKERNMSKFFVFQTPAIMVGAKVGNQCSPISMPLSIECSPQEQIVFDQIAYLGSGNLIAFRLIKANQPKTTRVLVLGKSLQFPMPFFPATKYVPMDMTAMQGNPLALLLLAPLYDYIYPELTLMYGMQDPLYVYPNEALVLQFFNPANQEGGFGLCFYGHSEPLGTKEGKVE